MSELKDVKMICPKCKNDTFRLQSKLINLKRIDAGSLLWNANEVCSKCGWKSKPDDSDEKIKRALIIIKLSSFSPEQHKPEEKDFELFDRKQKELVYWEGLTVVEEMVKIEKANQEIIIDLKNRIDVLEKKEK